jgi:hypothetical protein
VSGGLAGVGTVEVGRTQDPDPSAGTPGVGQAGDHLLQRGRLEGGVPSGPETLDLRSPLHILLLGCCTGAEGNLGKFGPTTLVSVVANALHKKFNSTVVVYGASGMIEEQHMSDILNTSRQLRK